MGRILKDARFEAFWLIGNSSSQDQFSELFGIRRTPEDVEKIMKAEDYDWKQEIHNTRHILSYASARFACDGSDHAKHEPAAVNYIAETLTACLAAASADGWVECEDGAILCAHCTATSLRAGVYTEKGA